MDMVGVRWLDKLSAVDDAVVEIAVIKLLLDDYSVIVGRQKAVTASIEAKL